MRMKSTATFVFVNGDDYVWGDNAKWWSVLFVEIRWVRNKDFSIFDGLVYERQ